MEITLKDNAFKIKSKTGTLYSKENGVVIESADGNTSKELVGPGEYEVSGISVIGVQAEESNIFVYEVDGLRICNLGASTKKIQDNKLSLVGDIDILLLPIGPLSLEMSQQIESYYIIPFGDTNDPNLEKYLKESGFTVSRTPKFSLKKEEIVEDQSTEIVLLEK